MDRIKLKVEAIKSAIASLPRSEVVKLGEWFRQFEAQVRDAQPRAAQVRLRRAADASRPSGVMTLPKKPILNRQEPKGRKEEQGQD